ncbi:hypothetical protein NKDENANG_01008 [Candidatus Entotheonellaceae bacterium PAL068K]
MTALKTLVASALNLRPGEGGLTAMLLAHSFFVGMTTVSFSTAANALFLATFDVGVLPYVYIGSAILAVLIGLLYTTLQTRLPFPAVLVATLLFLLLSVCAFRFGLWTSNAKWLAFAILFWLRLLLVLSNLEFWGLAGRLLNLRQGKRLFSLIGSGDLSANILGGFATPPFVMMFGTANLLLVSVVGLLLSLSLLLLIIRRFSPQLASPPDARNPPSAAAGSRILRLLRHRYILFLVLSNALMVMVYNFVDYTFYDFIKTRFQDDLHLAIFIGPFFATVQIITVLARTFLASRLFNRFGLHIGLWAHPLFLIVASGLIAATSFFMGTISLLFWLVAVMKLGDEVLWNSIYDSSLLILYQPLQAEQRRTTQIAVQSIFGPLTIGVSGVTLLLLGATETFTSVHLTLILPALLASVMIFARLIHREYPQVLTQALSRRTLEDVEVSLQDGASLALLQDKLKSPYAGEVIYTLDLLERGECATLPDLLIPLLEHPQIEVRVDALRRVERRRATRAAAAVARRLEAEDAPHVRAAALRTLCALGEEDIIDDITPYLDDPQPELRLGAMVGLLRYSGIEGVLAAGETLTMAAHAPEPARRAFAAQSLGEVGRPEFYKPLMRLLQDEDRFVRRTATEAAGKIQHPRLWPIVTARLSAPESRNAAVYALVAGGESALPAVSDAFTHPDSDRETRVRLARICGRIRGDNAIAILRPHLDTPDAALRTSVLTALCLCGYEAESGDHTRIHRQLNHEAAEAVWTWAAVADIGDDDDIALLRSALLHTIDQIHQRLFLLLSFVTDAQAMRRAGENFSHASEEKRAYALEIVDVLLSPELKPILLPLLEELSPAERLRRLHESLPHPRLGRDQRLRDILTRPELDAQPWTRVCALYSVAQLAVGACLDVVAAMQSSLEPLVRETAAWAFTILNPDASSSLSTPHKPGGQPPMFLTIEKVMILKSVPIFSETPDEVLAEVAAILDDIEYPAGETIFEKGEMGSCMYIIVNGKVRVHDGEHTLTHLGERELFGELAVLDPEPRSASVTAIEPTLLFRLEQEAFYELMADRTEVARGIIRVLCRQVRSRTAPDTMSG